jgi:hypothetical protein
MDKEFYYELIGAALIGLTFACLFLELKKYL